jgi:hypothetical protein
MSSGLFADWTSMNISLPELLVFILATIVGYFIGRIAGWIRDDEGFD